MTKMLLGMFSPANVDVKYLHMGRIIQKPKPQVEWLIITTMAHLTHSLQ